MLLTFYITNNIVRYIWLDIIYKKTIITLLELINNYHINYENRLIAIYEINFRIIIHCSFIY